MQVNIWNTFENIHVYKSTMLQHQQHSGKAKHQIRPKQQGMLLQGHNNEEHENEMIVLSHFYDI